MNQIQVKTPQALAALDAVVRRCDGLTDTIRTVLEDCYQHNNGDGTIFVPQIASAVSVAPQGDLIAHVVVIDDRKLWHFDAHSMSSPKFLSKLEQATHLPVFAVRKIPPLAEGEQERIGLAYIVVVKDITPAVEAPELPAPLKDSLPFDPVGDYPKGKPLQFCLGHDGTRLVWESLDELGHILIGGTTQWGKSSIWAANLMTLILNHSPELLRVAVIDGKGVNTAWLDGCPHLLTDIAYDGKVKSAALTLKALSDEVDKRRAAFRQVACSTLGEYNARVPEEKRLPNILLIFDEYADLSSTLEGKRTLPALFGHILRLGASLGITVIMATQSTKATVVDSEFRQQCNTRIAVHCADADHLYSILGVRGYQNYLSRLDRKGRMFIRVTSRTRAKLTQMPYLANEALLGLSHWNRQIRVGPGGFQVEPYSRISENAQRLMHWVAAHPERYNEAASLPKLAEDFGRQPACDMGDKLSAGTIRAELDSLKAVKLIVQRPGKGTTYYMTAELHNLVSVPA